MARFRPFLFLTALLTVTACRKQEGAAAPAPRFAVGLVTDVGGRGDHSFNDSALRGLEQWAAGSPQTIAASLPAALERMQPPIVPLGIKPLIVQSKNPEDYEPNLQLLVDQGASLCVATGFMLENALEVVARRNPEARFLLIDSPLLDAQGKPVTLPNVRTVVFREEEGGYLAGALAAYASETGKVGFIGGMNLPLIQRFEAGFLAGARKGRAGRALEVVSSYTGSFDNVGAGKQVAQDLINRGADVLYHAAGSDGLGVIQAVKEAREAGKNVWAIGVDSDQSHLAPRAVLTSMVKRVDLAVYEAARDLVAGQLKGGDRSWGLAERGVALAPVRVDFPRKDQALARVAELEKQIASGQLRVPARPADVPGVDGSRAGQP